MGVERQIQRYKVHHGRSGTGLMPSDEGIAVLYADHAAEVERLKAEKRTWWHRDIRPIINAIGELSVQEAMDAVERDL